jgi:chromosome segregation protein
MQKLTLTDQNLARVADVIGEVAARSAALRRQASKAMRYKRLNHRLRHLALAWSGYHHAQLSATLGALEAKGGAAFRADTRRESLETQQTALDEKKQQRAHGSTSACRMRSRRCSICVRRRKRRRTRRTSRRSAAVDSRTGWRRRGTTSAKCEMQLREVSAQVDTGAQDKQMQLGLLGSSDAVFQQRNRELAIARAS